MQELRRHLMRQVTKENNKLIIANALCVTGMEPSQSMVIRLRAS